MVPVRCQPITLAVGMQTQPPGSRRLKLLTKASLEPWLGHLAARLDAAQGTVEAQVLRDNCFHLRLLRPPATQTSQQPPRSPPCHHRSTRAARLLAPGKVFPCQGTWLSPKAHAPLCFLCLVQALCILAWDHALQLGPVWLRTSSETSKQGLSPRKLPTPGPGCR